MYFTPASPNQDRSPSLHQEIKGLLDHIILNKVGYKLKSPIKPFFLPLEGEAQEFGDYACYTGFQMWEELIADYPKLFDRIKPKDIAMKILNELLLDNTTTAMIRKDSVHAHDIGVVSFMLDGSWIAKKLEKLVTVGIHSFAPLISSKGRAIFVSKTNIPPADAAADILRANSIKQALSRMYLFSGIDVHDAGFSRQNSISLDLKIIKGYESDDEVDLIVYVTSDLEREDIQALFSAARSSLSRASLGCCGYRSFVRNPEKELSRLWQDYLSLYPSVFQLVEDAGYSREGFFVCALKFLFLKNHRLAEFNFDVDEILKEEGNSFRYVLNARALIYSVIKSCRGTYLFESMEALPEKEERNLGFHLLQFTRVIEWACMSLLPHHVCDYMFKLSSLFTSYYNEVRSGKQPKLVLCKAAEMVMAKCFDLLGITKDTELVMDDSLLISPENMSSSAMFSGLKLLKTAMAGKSGKDETVEDETVELGPCRRLADARYLNSRFEIFSMCVGCCLDDFDLFGTVSVLDAFGERADGWTLTNMNDRCFVSYFKRDWHNPLATLSGACIPLGDPSCHRAVPVSSSVELYARIQVSSKNRDKYYTICNVKGDVHSFSEFWARQERLMTGTLTCDGRGGHVRLYYALLKDAVDASMELRFTSTTGKSLQVCGQIMAYYGDGAVEDNGGILGQYKAVLFRTTQLELEGIQIPLKMYKSTVAVPVGGCLIVEASLEDLETKKVIFQDRWEFSATPGNTENWCMLSKDCYFDLKVAFSA